MRLSANGQHLNLLQHLNRFVFVYIYAEHHFNPVSHSLAL